MINDIYEGMPVKWADEFTMNRLTDEGAKRGEIIEIAHHRETGVPCVAIKFKNGSTLGMTALDCRLKMSKDE